MQVSNVGANDEGWPWVDQIPKERACDPTVLTDSSLKMPHFLHYCQHYVIDELKDRPEGGSLFSKYQVRHVSNKLAATFSTADTQ